MPRAAIRIKVLDKAEDDLVDGFDFYESQEPGIGTYFLNSLAADIASLRTYAGIHAIHFRRYHRLLSARFPFAIYYTFANDVIEVHAVLDCRRDPAWIRERLGG